MIELKNISAGYGKIQVLTDVSATFKKGQITGIVGPNGCGKSTLLKAVLGQLPLYSGQITLDGADLASFTPRQAAQRMAYLMQGHAVPEMTVAQMVLHGRFAQLHYPRRYRRQDKEAATVAMAQLHLTAEADTPLAVLSGGMRQKAYIAMALCQDTDYILMDEPTTYLDIAHRLQLMEILKDLANQGKGIVAVLHDLPLAMEYCDTVLAMQEGKTVAIGTPKALLDSGVPEQIFGVGLRQVQTPSGAAYYYEGSVQNG